MALDTGTTAWLLISTALVMFMTPGVGLFYGGMVRRKNFISMMALSFIALALATVQWTFIGYSLAFGPDIGGVIGGVAGVLCYKAMLFRIKIGYDESLDAWAVHGVGGLWGMLATGIFATVAVNKYPGLLEGNIDQFLHNALAAGVVLVYAFVASYLIGWVVDKTMGLRVSEEEEYVGLDISQHGERI